VRWRPTFEMLGPLYGNGWSYFKFGASKQNANIRDDQKVKSKPEV